MKQISLTSLSLSNFRSFTTPTDIAFSTGPGLKLITGQNEVEPRLGANGCGKSTIWDAVCFALYGTSVRGLRPSDLISTGKPTLGVSLVLKIDGETRVIHRTAPPMRIALDEGEPYDQDGIDRLVGLSRSQFLNSVVFGQAVPLFLDLPLPARGDLLDETLRLELWMEAADKATQQHREVNNTLIELRRAIARTQGRLDGLGELDRFAAQQADWQRLKQARLKELVSNIAALETQQTELQAQYDAPGLAPVDDSEAVERNDYFQTQNNKARERLAASNTELAAILKTVELLENNDACPVCGQSIADGHAAFYFDQIKDRLDELEKARGIARLDIQTTQDEIRAADETRRTVMRQNQERRSTRERLHSRLGEVARDHARLLGETERLAAETDPYAAEAERTAREHAQFKATLATQEAEEAGLVGQAAALDFWRHGFRKVRLYCLERVLQELEVETRNSLLALGLPGWQVGFTTASETRSGTVKLGVQIDIQAPDAARRFETMSGGEAQRARLAVSLGLANLIQRWAGVRFDLEVFDEPTAWLSSEGVDDLLESLRSRADTGRSIWVCDHRALAHAGFSEVLLINKTAEGSRING